MDLIEKGKNRNQKSSSSCRAAQHLENDETQIKIEGLTGTSGRQRGGVYRDCSSPCPGC